jgi:hypothetical protein
MRGLVRDRMVIGQSRDGGAGYMNGICWGIRSEAGAFSRKLEPVDTWHSERTGSDDLSSLADANRCRRGAGRGTHPEACIPHRLFVQCSPNSTIGTNLTYAARHTFRSNELNASISDGKDGPDWTLDG